MQTSPDEKDTKYLFSILSPLTKFPEAINIQRSVDKMGVLLSVSLHPDDIGRIIGRNGKTSQAIKLLVKQFGMDFLTRVCVKILTPIK